MTTVDGECFGGPGTPPDGQFVKPDVTGHVVLMVVHTVDRLVSDADAGAATGTAVSRVSTSGPAPQAGVSPANYRG